MKKIIIGTILSIFFIFICVIGILIIGNNGDKTKFKTEKVKKGTIISTVTATGTVNAVITVLVGTQVSGTIKHIYVDYNSPVKEHQLIALIDPATFEARVAQEKANLLFARANTKKAEANLLDTKRTMKRYKELFARGLVSESERDTAETNYDTAEAQLSAARAQVAQAEAALKYAETNLQYTRIISPVDGVVISRNVDVGQTVAASFQTPTLFTIAQDLTKMQIDTNVDEADIGKIQIGQNVEFTVDAYIDITFKGTVSQIRIAPIIVENVVTYDVVIDVDNPELKLKPGMTANVSIIVEKRERILKIPNSALRFKPVDLVKPVEHDGNGLWIIKKGLPRHIEVTTGISNGSYTEIVSGHIKEGQEVITGSSAKIKKQSLGRRGLKFF